MFRRFGCILVPLSSRLFISEQQKSIQKSLLALTGNLQPRLLAPGKLTMASASIVPEMNLHYDDILKVIENNSSVLIDVREPHELEQDGRIPNSTNIPLKELETALVLPPDEFKNKYGIPQPSKDSPLVFSCRSGNRSSKALLAALALGFKNSKHYAGGYLDWAKNACQN